MTREREQGRLAGSLIAALLALSGCGSGSAPNTATVRDSADVRIVEHTGVPTGLETWSLSAEPEAVIGARAEQNLAHQFTQIRGAVRLSDGRIVVGD